MIGLAGLLGIAVLAFANLNLRRWQVPRRAPDHQAGGDTAAPEDRGHDAGRDPLVDLLRDELDLLRRENAQLRQALLDRPAVSSGMRPDSDPSLARMILGIAPDAPIDKAMLRQAYTRSVRRGHPDQGGNEHSFRLILWAHDYLKEDGRSS